LHGGHRHLVTLDERVGHERKPALNVSDIAATLSRIEELLEDEGEAEEADQG
jgi:hypothetical protein